MRKFKGFFVPLVFAAAQYTGPSLGGVVSVSPCSSSACITELIQRGYQFAGGSDMGAEQTERVQTNLAAPYSYGDAKYRTGSAYFRKGSELVICSYTIVTTNPRKGESAAGDPALVGSKCYEIK